MYPALVIDKEKIKSNIGTIVKLCSKKNIGVSGVIKGCSGNTQFSKLLVEEGCKHIASSRIEQLKNVKLNALNLPTMLLRIPMKSEVARMINYVDISLASELEVIKYIELKCSAHNIHHKVILMMDIGDLREGYIDKEELIKTALYIENNLKFVELHGIGTNIGCYGSVRATNQNLNVLANIASEVEELIGRPLDIVSGGATSSLALVCRDDMPSKINNLRIGESILTARELNEFYGGNISSLSKRGFTLKAEIVEIKNKPTHPIGELYYDAFGNKPSFEDRGNKNRMILAVGRQDFGSHDKLIAITENIKIIGSSSDHLIVETISENHKFKLGDIIDFELLYPALLYLSQSSSVTNLIKL
ncbi:MAG: alanine racemase [Acidaminobacteraceae bacterium]